MLRKVFGIISYFPENGTEYHRYVRKQRTRRCSDQCRAGLDLVSHKFNLPDYPQDEILLPEHTAMPMLRSTINLIRESCADDLDNNITPLRAPNNINQYVYHYYQYYTGAYIDDICPYVYTEIEDDLTQITGIILNNTGLRLLCLNDLGDVKDYEGTRQKLLDIFDKKFPNKCRFEQ